MSKYLRETPTIMRIHQIDLPVSDVAATVAYFRDELQLPVEGSAVRIGWSTLQLQPAGSNPVGGVHLAFNVPANRFEAASDWLKARATLQRDLKGHDHFTFDGRWDSESIYFTGPDGLILELIARRRLPAGERQGEFHGSEMTCISEVGLPAEHVGEVQTKAEAAFGLNPLSQPTPHFAPLGDDEGLLIVVDATRRWFPEQMVLPNARGLRVVLHDVVPGAVVEDDALGWHLRSA